VCENYNFTYMRSLSMYRKEAGTIERRFKPEAQSNFFRTATNSLVKFNINSTSRRRRQRWPDGFVFYVTATGGSTFFSTLKERQNRKKLCQRVNYFRLMISSYANNFWNETMAEIVKYLYIYAAQQPPTPTPLLSRIF